MIKRHIALCSKLTSFEHHSGAAHSHGPCLPQGLRPFFLTIHARLQNIYKRSTVHSDNLPNHYLESSSGLQKGENDAPQRIHLALILGSKAQFRKLGLRGGMCWCSPGIMSGISPESQTTRRRLHSGCDGMPTLGPQVYLL